MRLVLYLSLLLLAGCSTVQPHNFQSVQGVLTSETVADKRKFALINYSTLHQRYAKEWEEFNKTDKASTPALGIALSGGGSRSAAFNLGLLNGLSRIGIMKKADAISSVSGGGYIASWYYLQRFYSPNCDELAMQPVSDDDIFDLNGKYQIYLSANGELVGTTTKDFARRAEYVGYGLITLVSWPVNLVLNGAFGTHANVVPIRRVYQNGIEREYHSVPSGSDGKALNDKIFGTGVREEATFKEFRGFVRKSGFPFPIINTTAHIQDDRADAKKLSSRIFEFTPLHYGSDYYGYRTDHPISINKAYTISGGAFDSKKLDNTFGRMFLSVVNLDLGYYIDNFNLTGPERFLPKLLPFPLYLFSGRHKNDLNGTSIYLADGGHSENLGVYSLIRRLTKNIVISDAEADPDYTFGAYTKLKKAVKDEFHAELSVPDIDNRVEALEACRKVDADHRQECAAAVPDVKPVMEGTISKFPYAEKGQVEKADQEVVIRVLYVKPTVDAGRVNDHSYPAYIREYYKAHKNNSANHVTTFGPFPQESTADQTYVSTQVAAYRGLGYLTVMENRALFEKLLGE